MPLYEFQCDECGHVFDILQTKYHDDRVQEGCPKCKKCGGRTRRLFSVPLVTYSGTGFYTTDSKVSPAPSEASKPSESGSLVD